MPITEQAPGKLNLALDVLAKRDDGYHEMRMLMQTVSLCDTVTIAPSAVGVWQLCCCDEAGHLQQFPQGPDNLAWRAAELFCRATGERPQGLSIVIRKRIPMQAGMAGGSADAAAMLRAMNRLYGMPLNTASLCRLALELGSDVPYCVGGGTVLAEGRGEQLTVWPTIPQAGFLLCKPSFRVPTASLFAALDKAPPPQQRPDFDALHQALESGDLMALGTHLCNVFHPLLQATHPEIAQLTRLLQRSGALGAQLTGTGSVVFGIYPNLAAAQRAAAQLHGYVPELYVAQPV